MSSQATSLLPASAVIDRRQFLAAALVTGAVSALAGPLEAAPAPDAALDSLVARMTVAEKAGQLHMEAALSYRQAEPAVAQFNPFVPPVTPQQARAQFAEQLARIRAGGVGWIMTPMDVESMILGQKAAVQQSRLKIPVLFAADIIHSDRTVFPVPLAEAASFDPELARRTARACAVEASARGLDAAFAPMVDVGRDQRWGRVVEGAGEDVLLARLFAAARVAGFQGKLGAADSLLACVKHFAAYGAGESGLDYQGNALSERVLHEVYLPPFQAAFDAGALLVMAAFNTVDGVPATGNRHLLTEILRDQMGFGGAVISDFRSEEELIAHGQAEDGADAVRLALNAGCDVGMVSGLFPLHIPALVAQGAISLATLDRAVGRVLRVKQAAGLFADPFRRLDPARSRRPAPPAHRELAREAAIKSIVLLRNEGGLLPLRAGQRIALVGPFGPDVDNCHGPWSTFTPDAPPVSLEQGLRAALPDPALLTVVPGCAIDAALPGGIEAARAAAQNADVVILALGESQRMSGESSSRVDIVIPPAQQALAEAMAATGKPLVVVLRHGRALALKGAVREAPALLAGWFLGTETGHALAAVLLGQVSPSGRLPVTFPQATGQEPYYYARESSGRPASGAPDELFKSHFIGLSDAPLYPFGHGLTYGDVRYGPVQAARAGEGVVVSASVTNAGSRAVEEVAQCYLHDVASEVVQPVQKLVAFEKLALAPGETRTVRFAITPAMLAHLDQACRVVAGSGAFDFWIAPAARTGTPAHIDVGRPA
ncbi:glycoside hydrolase family 3 N-terminal domain-containing protein [Novosphingobium sp. SG720]|uniref:glycoside hydrolase family 3 N-terminal domain-containing protein n=1 Tax=Novosphingobium sp. SG720 TaxID=2586998 RepID=UPI0014456F57|nr:glycoside hydrolase family 3 N-terminal domain-containing protein [Novosphingobium sp. SG720]NKJ41290.1 beta-glucosidase [Novosphingobium sp. SG720]